MVIEGSSMTIPMSGMVTSNPSGGRFDFDDGGTYCGGWQDGKAHGYGICTGPKNVGEYSGSWNFGFEMSGVYKWKNGAVYEGRWQNGKRHGVGVEYNGKWIYKGEWSQGFKGRYGVKASSNSAVKYEGTWANGLQDGYGSETYSDGGYYQGQMCRGLRHGYGVRKSAPYGDSQLNNPNKNGLGQLAGASSTTGPSATSSMLIHSNSLQSQSSNDYEPDDSPKLDDGFKPNIDRTLGSKNGFVLVAKPLEVPHSSLAGSGKGSADGKSGRRNSLTNRLANSAARIPGSSQTATIFRTLRLRKQKSTGDLDNIGAKSGGQYHHGHNQKSNHSSQQGDELSASLPFSLSPEELDISDPTTVETYTGEWKHDKRNGHGVCDRSDGLRYEGQWHNDMKCGYGVTTFKNGTKEEGKYKNNILIIDSKLKRLFQFGGANIRQRIDESVKMAQQAQTMSLKKEEIADTRAATARDKADQATTAALEAQRDSKTAYSVAREYNYQQSMVNQQQSMLSDPQQLAHLDSMASGAGWPQNRVGSRMNAQQVQQPAMYRNSPASYESMSHDGSRHFDSSNSQHQQLDQQQQHQQQDLNQQQQYLSADPTEPFNGRRGSFRGSQQSQTNNLTDGHHGSRLSRAPRITSTSYFSDPFDHYKPSFVSSSSGAHPSKRPTLNKQTSLDNSHLRSQQANDSQNTGSLSSSRLQRLRMSSLDHADERSPSPSDRSTADRSSVAANQAGNNSNMQQQFRHLVTSGEDLMNYATSQQTGGSTRLPAQDGPAGSGATPAGSSYILPQSTGSSFGGQPSPSPDGSNFRQQAGPYYAPNAAGQRIAQFHPSANHLVGKQRDVHSLADERLYLAGRRAQAGWLADRTEYANYDFTISSGPRPARRVMRRTASLSRQPINGSGVSASELKSGLSTVSGSATILSQGQSSQRNIQPPNQSIGAMEATTISANDTNHLGDQQQTIGRYSPDSTSSSGFLHRKPSLQVRYNPVELGGLMSREEVAALSHAQREQKRIEAEIAEKRAKRPLLHLFMSLKDFFLRQKLALSVLLVNVCLFKMFADLIIQ